MRDGFKRMKAPEGQVGSATHSRAKLRVVSNADAPSPAENLLSTADDNELLVQVSQGNRAAFAEVLKRYLPLCVSIARRVLHDHSEAEDIAQETMLKLWRNNKSIANVSAVTVEAARAKLRPWLARVAYNAAIDRLRQRRPMETFDDVPEIPVAARQVETLEHDDLKTRVEKSLSALPERQRSALTLFQYQGFSQSEIADTMAISVEAVESLLARARRALRNDLQQEWRSLLVDES